MNIEDKINLIFKTEFHDIQGHIWTVSEQKTSPSWENNCKKFVNVIKCKKCNQKITNTVYKALYFLFGGYINSSKKINISHYYISILPCDEAMINNILL